VVDRLEPEYEGRVEFKVFGEVNSDRASSELAGQHGVTAIPTMMIVAADGTEIDRHLGGIDEAGLREFVDQALAE